MALKAAPILAEALKHSPYNMHNQRYKAMVYRIMGKKDKAINIYTHLIKSHRQSYLYHELSELLDDERYKIALLCKAISAQRALAGLLFRKDKARARYELDKCIAMRKQLGYSITWEMQNLIASLEEVIPVTDADEKSFYREQEVVLKELVR